jgi:peptide/nickel transport system substrate-binding protein
VTLVAYGSVGSSAATGSSSSLTGLFGSLPAVGTPAKGGTISVGFLTGETPLTVFPITTDAQASVFTTYAFQYDFWLPLYNGPVGATQEINYAISLANKPSFTNGDKTITIPMKSGFKWSNGQPVDGNDLVFDIDLAEAAVKESPANLSSYAPGLFPANVVSVSAPSKYTVVIHLAKALNPSFFLNNELESENSIVPMPSSAWNIDKAGGPHLNYTVPANAKLIYNYLAKLGASVATFGTNPLWKIADGPFILKTFNATNSSWTATPNPDFGGSPKPAISELEGETFTSQTAMLNALKSGAVDISSQIDDNLIGQAPALRSAGYSVFGYPDLGFTYAAFNFKDATGHFNSIIAQLYVRQALAHLVDEPGYISGIFKGAAGAAYGPVPAVPPTAFTPSDSVHPPYPYNPAAAVSLLKSHGWDVVPGGQTTCAKPGSGAGECGAGIPKGTPFKFTWAYISPSTQFFESLISEAFASEAKAAVGINVTLLPPKSFNFLFGNYNDANPAGAKYTNDWGVEFFGGFTDDFWPTTNSIFNIGGSYNQGGYDDATANSLIHNSVYGSSTTAVTDEASYLTQQVPALFMPNPDLVYAVSTKVGGSAQSFTDLTQYATFPQFWYVNK